MFRIEDFRVMRVVLNIRVEQHPVDDEAEVVEYVTDGMLFLPEHPEQSAAELHYEESSLTDMEGVHTSVTFSGDRVVVDRDGSMETHMIFEKNHRHVSLYETPCGCVSVATTATEVIWQLEPEKGHLKLSYGLEVENALRGRNSIEITYS